MKMPCLPPLVCIDGNAMSSSPYTVRHNTFFNEQNVYIDPISKIFIVLETALGIFKIPLIKKWKLFFNCLALFYVISLNVALVYLSVVRCSTEVIDTMAIITMIQYSFCCLFGLICCKKLQHFYGILNKFDKEVGCTPKVTRHAIHNLAQSVVMFALTTALSIAIEKLEVTARRPKHIVILHIANSFEMSYYGHLLSLLTPRLKLINYFIESSLANAKLDSDNFLKGYSSTHNERSDRKIGKTHFRIRKLMDLYHVIVEGYEYLNDAIKWQLLVTIITVFLTILGLCYFFSLNVIKGGADLIEGILQNVCSSVLMMIPLFAPCIFGDKVHREVRRLRELLASKLYENKLDKSGRSIARALLAFTDTRDLSFRLLRMLNIDISLPFKFMGLLATYLIILLQFEKVVNP